MIFFVFVLYLFLVCLFFILPFIVACHDLNRYGVEIKSVTLHSILCDENVEMMRRPFFVRFYTISARL